jgi:nucleoside triphosphate pyrophosphatase
VAVFLAEKKSSAFFESNKIANPLIITADTIVCCKNTILGKPKDYEHAFGILNELSDGWHSVISGVCIQSKNKKTSFFSKTDVHFQKLTNEEIDFYLTNFKPYDKAGSYGIQEWIGHIAIDQIKGSFYNVMGLPIQKLYAELKDF